ncbi:MAG: hypothetical protein HRU41_18995 [Saprospiraceae bacterium]|nr:hypothetical protein [Saprospiraceae bacterium]
MTQKLNLAIGLFSLLTLLACGSHNDKYIPDVSDIEVDVKIDRFEQALFTLDTSQFESSMAELEQTYPDFSEVYFNFVLGSKNPEVAPEGHLPYMRGFIGHPGLTHLYDTTQVLYQDISGIEEELTQAMQFYRYYFPNAEIPTFTTFLSEYSIAAFIYGEQALAIGLDFFLGADYPYWKYNPQNSNFSDYMVRTYNQDHLVSKTLQPLIEDHVGPASGERLIDLMVHNGKKLYLRELLLPHTPDSVLLEMTPVQVKWLKDNEFNIWSHFIENELLYSSEFRKIRKLVEYSPTGPTDMPAEAPGRVGNWMGLQIVKRYMQRHPEVSIEALLNLRDAQLLLDESRYRPRR